MLNSETLTIFDVVNLVFSRTNFINDFDKFVPHEDRQFMLKKSSEIVDMFRISDSTLTEKNLRTLKKIGEDIMVGNYIIAKLDREDLTSSLYSEMLDIEYSLLPDDCVDEIRLLILDGNITFVLWNYRYMGREIGEGNYTNYVTPMFRKSN